MMSISEGSRGSIIHQTDFRAERTADALELGMQQGWRCNKELIYQQIIRIDNEQRQMVCDSYKTKYGKDLIREMVRSLSGDFEDVIVALLTPPLKYDVTSLNNAMRGLGTRESTLIDIICTRTDAEKRILKEAYQKEIGRSLEDDVIDDTSGDFQRLLVSLLQCRRDTADRANMDVAAEDALAMTSIPEHNELPDITTYNCAFASQSIPQLKALFEQYQVLADESIQDGIRKAFSGDAREAYLAVADSVINTPKYFARRLYESMKAVSSMGLGTADTDLIYVIVSRSEIDLLDIQSEFDKMYDQSLTEWIKSDCSGAYRDALLEIVRGNRDLQLNMSSNVTRLDELRLSK